MSQKLSVCTWTHVWHFHTCFHSRWLYVTVSEEEVVGGYLPGTGGLCEGRRWGGAQQSLLWIENDLAIRASLLSIHFFIYVWDIICAIFNMWLHPLGCYHRITQTRWLIGHISLFHTVLESGKSKIKVPTWSILVSLVHRSVSVVCPHMLVSLRGLSGGSLL